MHSFPTITGRVSVSPGLGSDPVWGPDGRSLYYRSGSQILSVDVTTEPSFAASAPTLTLEAAAYVVEGTENLRNWDLHPDGSRFLFMRGNAVATSRVFLVTNWFEELRARMGG